MIKQWEGKGTKRGAQMAGKARAWHKTKNGREENEGGKKEKRKRIGEFASGGIMIRGPVRIGDLARY